MRLNILGVEMIDQAEVGKIIGTKSRSTISEWLARAGLSGVSIKSKKWYSVELMRDFFRYEKVEIRKAVELLREIQIQLKKEKSQNDKQN